MKTLMVIAFAATAFSAPALAQAPGAGGGMMKRDQTRAEAQQRADMMFQMMDANRDGTMTKVEADQALAQFAARSGGDANNSGTARGGGRMQRMLDQAFATSQSLTQAQFDTQILARFDAMDLNHDGTVTTAERQQVRAQRQARMQVQPAVQPQPKPQ